MSGRQYPEFWGSVHFRLMFIGTDHWGNGATTLEWAVSSPPPLHTYAEPLRVR